MDIVDALGADRGTTCLVGAGGKKTTLYALAARIDRAVVTATVRIPIFDQHVAEVVVTDDPGDAVRTADQWPLGLVPEQERDDRYRGYDRETVTAIAEADAATAVLVKADGARTREFKAPDDQEPQISRSADTVVPVVSAHAVGKPLTDEYVHRPERVAAITGRDEGDEIRPVDVAAVLASDDGGLKRVPDGATTIPLINKVDDEELADVAGDIAEQVIDSGDVSRVVLARMVDPDPLVAVEE